MYSPVYLSGFPFFGGYRNCTTFILQMAQHINFVMLQTGHQSMEGYCWFSHDVTKFQTSELLILLRFYFHDVKEQLKTNLHTDFHSEWVLGLLIDYS